ncbi:MAG TPA: ABC transporter substrate-binding protein [Candidatus Avimonoglobus intestinipullorum]|uniref:ABC transporter substrate-binding protein n=1 Tax=Candidatus Avimonoglobus intestinipullorum TaxID=2840699 RepID=A0A9D1LV81_9FIRM|nr:ABC transporter substrate-binding protein [Candidatus Avimonoglobus intestinipullorum]
MKKVLAIAAAAVLSASVLAGCTGGTDQSAGGDTVTIGGIGPLTGDAASYGISVKNGGELAVEEINAAGGINGKQIVYLYEDDENDAQKAINAYNRLMDQGMQVLMGTVTSNPCIAVADESVKDGILQLSPSGSAKDCTKNPNGFRICFTDPQQGEKMAEYIWNEEKLTKIAVIYDSSDSYSTGIKDAFREKFTALGGTVVTEEAFVSGDKDFKAQLTKISGTDAEGLFLPFYYTEVAYVVDQAKSLGLQLPYFGCDGWDGVIDQLKGNTEAIEGAVFLTPFIATAEKENIAQFVQAYEAKYNETPDQFAADAYDAIYVIKAAIEKAGEMDNDKIIQAMTEIEVDGVTGQMSFTADGEPDKVANFAVIQNGEYIIK